MAETLLGVGVVWGLTTGATASGMGVFLPQSADFSVDSDRVEVRNGLGQVVGEVYHNQRQTMTMEVIPSSTTIALSRTANVMPAPGAVVTVTDTVDTELAATHAGKYIFIRGSKKKTNTDLTKLTFELVQYVENDVAVVIS